MAGHFKFWSYYLYARLWIPLYPGFEDEFQERYIVFVAPVSVVFYRVWRAENGNVVPSSKRLS